jgi:hypothetical protein
MSKSAIRAGDRAFVKVGRNLVEVRVDGKVEGGWSVTSRTGKSMTVRTLLTAEGETLEAHEAETPAKATKPTPARDAAKAKPAAPSPKAVPHKGLGLLSAAAAVLERSDAPMSVKAMIEAAKSEGLWSPGGGKTPEQTLYSAIIREIRDKGNASRFRKEGRGLFAFAQ